MEGIKKKILENSLLRVHYIKQTEVKQRLRQSKLLPEEKYKAECRRQQTDTASLRKL